MNKPMRPTRQFREVPCYKGLVRFQEIIVIHVQTHDYILWGAASGAMPVPDGYWFHTDFSPSGSIYGPIRVNINSLMVALRLPVLLLPRLCSGRYILAFHRTSQS